MRLPELDLQAKAITLGNRQSGDLRHMPRGDLAYSCRHPVVQEEAMKTTTAKQRTNQRAVKLADFDWRKFYDKETQEKLLAGCAIY